MHLDRSGEAHCLAASGEINSVTPSGAAPGPGSPHSAEPLRGEGIDLH
jgi:hypothetical protein